MPAPRGASKSVRLRPDDSLVALSGGPKDGQWYWLSDWRRAVNSVQAQRFPLGHPANEVLYYQPTGQKRAHRDPGYGLGELWTYQPPRDLPPAPPPETVTPAPRQLCAGCGQPILLRRPGRGRCARCRPDQQADRRAA